MFLNSNFFSVTLKVLYVCWIIRFYCLQQGMIDVTRPLGDVWVLLSRVDGLCGRMLGRAVAKGFDDVRAWVCCLVSCPVLYHPIPGVLYLVSIV